MPYCIYMHTCRKNGKKYIGQTCQKLEERWGKGGIKYKNSFLFWSAIKKYGWDNFDHIVLESNIPNQEKANEREIYYIELFHTFIEDPQSNGYNLTRGGSDNEHQKGKPVYCFELDKIYRSIGEASRELKIDKGDISKVCSGKKNTINKMHFCYLNDRRTFKFKKAKRSIMPVYCYELNKTYESIRKASKELKLDPSAITKYCKGKIGIVNGYTFCYVNELDTFKAKKTQYKRKVIRLDTLKVYNSMREASKDSKAPEKNISNCCRGKQRHSAGIVWEYYEENKIYTQIQREKFHRVKRKVIDLTTGKIYNSISETIKDGFCRCSVSACCKNENRTANGHKFAYYFEKEN